MQNDVRWRVLERLAAGLGAPEVAAELDLPVAAVHAELERAMTELDAHSQFEAILIAAQRGLITLPAGSA